MYDMKERGSLSQLNLKNKKYIIFDVDGTLVDSISSWNMAEQKLIADLSGQRIDLDTIHKQRQDFLHEHPGGNIYLAFCDFLIRRYAIDKIKSAGHLQKLRLETANDLLAQNLDLRPCADKVILKFHNMDAKIILATLSTRKQVGIYFNNSRILEKINVLGIADLILTEEDVRNKKPDPEIYNKVLEYYHAAPEQCLVFEDSYSGVLAGKRAGIEVVNIPDKYSASEQEKIDQIADYKIFSYDEMLNFLTKRSSGQ